MNHPEQINSFKADVDKLVTYYRREFNLPYASAVGVLEIIQQELVGEALNPEEPEEENETS